MESLQSLFEDSSFESMILETGFRKPLHLLTMEDKPGIQETLRAHVILKVKPEMDQFSERLRTCGILDAVEVSVLDGSLVLVDRGGVDSRCAR